MAPFPRSLPRICVALGLPSPSELSRAAERECKDGSTFLEFRLDYLPDAQDGVEVLRRLRQKHPGVSVLATCRHKANRGGFKGTIAQQLSVLRSAGEAGAAAIDIEIESAEQAKQQVKQLRTTCPVLVSYHDFERTPALLPVLRRLQHITADAYKIATTAVKQTDNARLIEFAQQKHATPLVLLAMTDVGSATRILAPSAGSLFTYAAPCEGTGTASGQLSAPAMRNLYRCDKLTGKTRVYGIIADPVAHSKSPLMHNRAFQARRMDAVYVPFRVPSAQLGDFMKLADTLPVCGFSVTIPHKQKIIRHLDTVDSLAKRIGAVNTVWRKAGKWRGANTDVQGVLKPLARHLRFAHSSILIAGYGGAARAAAIALADEGATIAITGRDLAAAHRLARVIKAEVLPLRDAERASFDALIHATPVGMFPNVKQSLFEKLPASLVLDMVYNPRETLLLKRAAEQGCTVIPGLEMLLEQALCQFEIWTGETAPRSAMRNALQIQ